MTWYGSNIYVVLDPQNFTVSYGPLVFRVVYVNDTAVEIAVANMGGTGALVNLTLLDYYDPSSNTTLQLWVDYYNETTVAVWSNQTVVRLSYPEGGEALFLVRSWTPGLPVSLPEELGALHALVPMAIVIALGARGSLREAGLGLVAYAVLAPWLTQALGVGGQAVMVSSSVSLVLGGALLATGLAEGGSVFTQLSLTSIGRRVFVAVLLWGVVSSVMTTVLVFMGAPVPEALAFRFEQGIAQRFYDALSQGGALVYLGALGAVAVLSVVSIVKNVVAGLPLLVMSLARATGDPLAMSGAILLPVAGFLQLAALYYVASWIRGVVRE